MSKKVIEREAKIMQGSMKLKTDFLNYLSNMDIENKPEIIYSRNIHTKGKNTIKLREYIDTTGKFLALPTVINGHHSYYESTMYENISKIKDDKGSKVEVVETINSKEQFDQLVNMLINVGSKDSYEIYYAEKIRYNLSKINDKFKNMTLDFCEIMFNTNPSDPEKGIYVPLPFYIELEYLADGEDDKTEFKDAYKLLLKELYGKQWKDAKEIFTVTDDSIRNLIKKYRKYTGASK